MPRNITVESDDEPRPLTPEEIEEFRELLLAKRRRLLTSFEQQRVGDDEDGPEKLPDEGDQATAEYEIAFLNRMRDRDQYLLKKIEKALRRIEEGVYDQCEDCGDPIGKKRLLARPEATLCIACKEEQEREERGYLSRREMMDEEFEL